MGSLSLSLCLNPGPEATQKGHEKAWTRILRAPFRAQLSDMDRQIPRYFRWAENVEMDDIEGFEPWFQVAERQVLEPGMF